ncbi:sn-glycerol-3-phosphate ABC transporter ATP-binding protein UgpC [Jatrophihabitans telluris]|uniref:Sn-glycerol-3-phosphate ABC transporter ATP-binding protein UgpC n=1 Tax=Jatrophihabitans telluris TaxID=2038343 RepID=A0ABY4QZ49_9ACTN|nr:sn-glycerol-3-phosphate ABC transporter ATP-binding protein UgpC [Jatrophihabitans telluris]UQX88946.1 sn-glycerol-3-phosphate ABC transporter ATP-binding protein UgpC [Jatrophihabitans telluris]
MAAVEYVGASRIYPGNPVPAVNKLDLDIADGEFMVLVGPSGSGKSTALRMLAGLEDVNEGEIRIGGTDVSQKPPKDRDIAMVFQNYALYPHMSVAENMGFALKLKGVSKEERAAKVLAAAKLLDLERYLERKPKALSGGQRQRVAMGRAIVREPSVFLMDEPLSNLDAKLRVETRANIAALQARLGTTTLYVTHDQVEAMTMGDRVALLKDGMLQQVDTPRNLYDRPGNAFVAGFIGSPAMNLVKVPITDAGARLGNISIPLKADAMAAIRAAGLKEVILGVRPESFTASSSGDGLRVKANLVEELGADAFVYGDLEGTETVDVGDDGGAKPFVVRFDGRIPPKIGNEITLDVRTEETHVFHPETGERLGD